MIESMFIIVLLTVLVLGSVLSAEASPIRLHPDNPHYFLFKNKPTVLITSGEHYGAVLNADFDYTTYLNTLAKDGLNNTRVFIGAYCEHPEAFNIAHNTLAPAPERFLSPWKRSNQSGYANGGNKFDLHVYDDTFFVRLKDFMSKASAHDIVVEINLFCPFYKDDMWHLSPMNSLNNINGLGTVSKEDVYTLDKNGGLFAVQETFVQKVVTELKDYDNLYYEIMNEPYVRKVPMDWQRHIVDVIAKTEKNLQVKHLISLNIANHKAKVENLHPAVSILNFHYAWPPETVAMNYDLDRAIGDNETGFKSTGDFYYRREGWAFLLSGGALYNNLDYSFTVGHENGTFEYPAQQPGGGTVALRRQLGILKTFVHGFDFVRMTPDNRVISGELPENIAAYTLMETGKQYAIYMCRTENDPPAKEINVSFQLDLPQGEYAAEWINTLTGEILKLTKIVHKGGVCAIPSPAFAQDVALRIIAE